MTNAEMQTALAANGSVIWAGKILTTIASLPSDAQITAETARKAAFSQTVETSEIEDSAITTAKLAAANVTIAKLSAAANIRVFDFTQSNLAAGADVSATIMWNAPSTGAVITGAYIIPGGSSAGIDDSNTAVISLTDTDGNAIVAKTYNTATQPPAAGVVGSLGTPSATHGVLAAGEALKYTIVQGSTADLPACTLRIEYKLVDA